MGVRRAVELVLDAPQKHEGPINTFGPLIHNPQVLQLLEEKGIKAITDIPEKGTGTILIRAHGIPPEEKRRLKDVGFNVIDATCPRVIKVQSIIRKHSKQGYVSIIIGDKDHPEVAGLMGYAKSHGYVVDNLEDLDTLPQLERAIVVAQTTQNKLFFDDVKKWAAQKFPHYKIFDTICDSTARRQTEVQRLADDVDAIIVVGGHNSGNTKRLAETARRTGKPTYHVETEAELDLDALTAAKHIGVTAGASTPNWIIRRIYRTLETFPLKKGKGVYRHIFAVQHALLLTNIYVSLGAGFLCYAIIKLQGITHYFSHVLIAMLYVQSMHILNNVIGTKADRYNDPDRASFYDKNQVLLVLLSFTAGGVGLVTAYAMGLISFLILFVMSVMGLSYNLRLIPEQFARGKYRRIRDIPGSKTILIAVAWGIVTSVLPSLSARGGVHLDTVLIFLWSISLVFVRTAFFDILDMQGDRIVGRESIPIILGEKKALLLLKSILWVNLSILLLSSALGLISNLGYFLIVSPIFVYIVLSAHEQGYMLPGTRLEFLVDTHFVLAGITAIIWSLL